MINDQYQSLRDLAARSNKLNEGLELGEGYFGDLAGVLGYSDEARRITADLRGPSREGVCSCFAHCLDRPRVGETDKTLDVLENALVKREPYLASIMVFPGYDPIRDQPRFRQLVQQLKLPS